RRFRTALKTGATSANVQFGRGCRSILIPAAYGSPHSSLCRVSEMPNPICDWLQSISQRILSRFACGRICGTTYLVLLLRDASLFDPMERLEDVYRLQSRPWSRLRTA